MQLRALISGAGGASYKSCDIVNVRNFRCWRSLAELHKYLGFHIVVYSTNLSLLGFLNVEKLVTRTL